MPDQQRSGAPTILTDEHRHKLKQWAEAVALSLRNLTQDLFHQLIYSLKPQADGSTALFINQSGKAAPTTLTLNGGQRAKIIGSEIDFTVPPTNADFNTYKWSATSWAANGTLVGGVAQANFNDVITGTEGNNNINGLGGNDALAGGAGNDIILSARGIGVPQRTGPNQVWQTPSDKTLWIRGSNWDAATA